MKILLILWGVGIALELLTHTLSTRPRIRAMMAVLALFVTNIGAGALAAYHCNVFTVLLALVSLYRSFNMVRIAQGRMHAQYLKNATRTTTWSLLGFQAVILVGWAFWDWHPLDTPTLWAIMSGVQLAAAVLLLSSTMRTMRKTTWPANDAAAYSLSELPTLTVAIPARNETDDLQDCLRSVIASDYPKLEIIVLDDCSQLRRTPEIIREFAQDGVRFIPGDPPRDTWLPKNQAYERLAQAASGQYLLFCGVDMRFEPHSIRQLITTMLKRDKQMLCVLPQRHPAAYGQFSLLQAMRYWWELAPPRRLFARPPVLSSCWIVTSQALAKAGGFAAVSRAIMPEAHIAKQLLATDSYSFLRSNAVLGLMSVKRLEEQRDTALRMRYPQLHKRPEQVALLSFLESLFILLPFITALGGFWLPIGAFGHMLALTAALLLVLAYEQVVLQTKVNSWWFGVIGQPLAVLADVILLHYSMAKYEFSTVEWKGRNICIPMMHVVPTLPRPLPAADGLINGHEATTYDHGRASDEQIRQPARLQATFQRHFDRDHELTEISHHQGRRRHAYRRRRRHHRHRH